MGHSRSLEMAPFERVGRSYLSSVETMTQTCIILEIERDIGQKSNFSTISTGLPATRTSAEGGG